VDPRTTSRRSFLVLAAGGSLAATLAACGGTSGPSPSGSASAAGGGGSGGATYWTLNGQPNERIRTGVVTAFNKANPDNQIKVSTYANEPYKTKIKTAIGAGNGPTIIWGWGGGTLESYVDAGQVEDLTEWFAQNPTVKDRVFPSAFAPATVDGKLYALPVDSVQPIMLFYNKEKFEEVGAQPPQSWDELMALVPRFNDQGIAPFSLAGQARWTNMMWLEFLFDRIGGPEVFQAAFEGEKGAWSNPDAINALTKVQDLVNANGFIKGFASISADANADQAVLYRGKAAMMLHGSWSYGVQKDLAKKFVADGKLGWMNFPPVNGGKGDPSNTVGNPGQYLSISSKATAAQKETAKKFFATGVGQEAESKAWIETGAVPIINGTESLIAASPDAPFLQSVYDIASKAKVFSQSWDQALGPAAAEALLDNISKLFGGKLSPQQFATNMNAVTGK
jgi:raffinose/stachyose/melibiose transport system substrate-binding protein